MPELQAYLTIEDAPDDVLVQGFQKSAGCRGPMGLADHGCRVLVRGHTEGVQVSHRLCDGTIEHETVMALRQSGESLAAAAERLSGWAFGLHGCDEFPMLSVSIANGDAR